MAIISGAVFQYYFDVNKVLILSKISGSILCKKLKYGDRYAGLNC